MTAPLEFPTLRAVSSQPPTVHQLQSRFPTLAGLCGSFQPLVSAPGSGPCLQSQSSGWPCALAFSRDPRRHRFLSLFSVSLVRTEWQLPSSLCAELELCASFSNLRGLVYLVRSPTGWASLQGSFRLREQLGMHWI